MSAVPPPARPCATCGRPIEWRRKWARDWAHVKYCSDACRGPRARADAARIEAAVLDLLAARPAPAAICPSEVARALDATRWRDLMEPVRDAARRLAAAGRLVVTQGGRPIEAGTARGPIRLRSP